MALPATCPDCGAGIGTAHIPGCDVARCLWTGQQRLQCVGQLAAESCRIIRPQNPDLADELAHYLSLDDPDHDCGEHIWDGTWPGEQDAIDLGLWCYGPPWRPCSPDHPEARPDLNRLAVEGRWDRTQQKWVLR